MQLNGFHHLTAVTADAPKNLRFYTQTLGMRLVKKTVNQDDVSAYHLFYADGRGTPGTDVTFFDWPMTRERRGTNSITRTGLRVANLGSLRYWESRLKELSVTHTPIADRDGRPTLDLEDFEGQRLRLVADHDGPLEPHPWAKSLVPAEHQVRGLGPITISVPVLEPTDAVLTTVMNMRHAREYENAGIPVHVYEMSDGTAHAQLHVAVERDLPPARNGAGGVHHVAFRVPTFEAYDQWYERLNELGVRSSGPVDRFYFRSLYFREPNGILFEIATDGPGFAVDEDPATLGEKIVLAPFLEPRRAEIVKHLKSID